jgi:hypothetical protein
VRPVTVRYHHEPEGWWAETDALPNYSAAGASFEAVRDLVRAGLPELLGEPLDFYDDVSDTGSVVPVVLHTGAALARFGWASESGTQLFVTSRTWEPSPGPRPQIKIAVAEAAVPRPTDRLARQ